MSLLLLLLPGTTSAYTTPLLHAARRSPALHMKESFHDAADFLNTPFQFIEQHPDLFSEELQSMVKYQLKLAPDDFAQCGELPEALASNAQWTQQLQAKSFRADELANIILKADKATMQTLSEDATFEEKKNLFESLAALPEDARGMLGINDVVSSMLEAGKLPALASFEGDLAAVTAKVAEANAALQELDEKYTTLFLSVRKVAKLSKAAAEVLE